jgi:hypothetical protein
MKLPVILGSLVVASTAYAQAPGDYSGDGDYGGDIAPPGMAPTVAPVVVAAPPPPQRRWSVGIGFGNLELAPHTAPEASTDFDIAQLYVRYRPWRHLEIELALGGGHETDGEYNDGYRDVSSAVLALRYRFSPQRRWNWWLMAGMGSLAVTNEYASDEERDSASQSTLQFGAGIERRWTRFALQFELRAVGVAPHDTDDMAPKAEPYPTNTMEPPGSYPAGPANDGWAGGQFVFSGNYYF